MKYQLLKHNPSGRRSSLGMFDTINEAKKELARRELSFKELSYIGGFPIYEDDLGITYSIQGFADIGMVCSLSGEALAQLRR